MAGGPGAVAARSAPHALPHACHTPGCLCPRSRLAACIKLTKEMDGITVLVPETNQDLTNCALHHPHPHPGPNLAPTKDLTNYTHPKPAAPPQALPPPPPPPCDLLLRSS